MRGMRRMLALVGVLALAAGCGGEGSGSGAEEGGGGRLSIATGGTSGVYFVYGGGLAKVISSNLEGYRATAETTSASVDNLILIKDGGSDIAFTLADTALDAVEGREAFKEKVPMRVLAQIYDNYTQVVAKAGSGIKTIEDLKGKRVSVGAPNSGTEVIADRIFEAAEIDPKGGIKRQGLGVDESVQAMKDGSIDAFFWSGGLPTGAITDLVTSDKITLLDTTVYTDKLVQKYGEVYRDETIPKGTYKGVEQGRPDDRGPELPRGVGEDGREARLRPHQAPVRPEGRPGGGPPGGEEPRPEAGRRGDRADRAPPRVRSATSTRKVPRPLAVLALAGALLAAGCGGREVVVRDDGGHVLVKAALPGVGALRARVPPLLLPRRGARAVPRRRRGLPHGRGRVAERGGARLLRDRRRQDARALDGARARAARATSTACR